MQPIRDNGNDDERRITYFATTHTRGKREMFGIRAIDRGKHMYVIGKTGMGKSTMLENMAIQDIQNGEGIAYIDPHGSTAEKLLDFVPHERIKDVLYFAPFDTDYPIGFNVMEDVGYDKRHLVVSGLMGAFKRIWVDAWSARMEYILQNVLLALLEYPGSTLLDVNRMLTNKPFRAAVIEKITDPIVKSFWTEEFAGYTDRYTQEATPAIQNKVGQFVANPLVRNIVGQPQSTFDLRKIMDEKKIFIVNLSKGRMGESNAALLGSMLTVKIYLAAMSRADEPPARMAKLPRCYFYVDEFQSMMNEAFADILSESRKYKLALTLANQYIEQMEENVRNAVFGNVGTLITFRVGPFDAEVLKVVFEPTFEAEDLVGLGLGQIYLSLMIDGVGSAPFSAETVAPIQSPAISYREDVIHHTRHVYAKHRSEVEAIIGRRQEEFAPPPKVVREPRDMNRSSSGNGSASGGSRSYPPRTQSSAPTDRPRSDAPRPQPAPERPQSRPEPVAQPHMPAPPAPPAPAPQTQPVDQRSALRDAIASIQKRPDEKPRGAIRSPADIIRERKAHRESRQNESRPPAPDASRAGEERTDEVPQKPRETPRARRENRENREDRGVREEVSTEDLRKILTGGDHAA
ncbi:MAG: type IV secretion system DNA-binding domain-containing protein [Minisyncoccia bacterium]